MERRAHAQLILHEFLIPGPLMKHGHGDHMQGWWAASSCILRNTHYVRPDCHPRGPMEEPVAPAPPPGVPSKAMPWDCPGIDQPGRSNFRTRMVFNVHHPILCLCHIIRPTITESRNINYTNNRGMKHCNEKAFLHLICSHCSRTNADPFARHTLKKGSSIGPPFKAPARLVGVVEGAQPIL